MRKVEKFYLIRLSKFLEELKSVQFLYMDNRDLAEPYVLNNWEADVLRSSIPTRIFIPKDELYKQYSMDLFPICPIDEINIDDIKTEREEEEFILKIYDEWLVYLLKRKNIPPPSVSIFFGDDYKAREWEKTIENPKWISSLTFHRRSLPVSNNRAENVGDINIWRHIKLKEVLDSKQNPLYYEMASYHNPFFSFLFSISPQNTQFLAKYIIRQIVEFSLLHILIVDDRIARTLWNRHDCSYKVKELMYMGISIAKKITIAGEDIPLVDETGGDDKGMINIAWEKDGNINAQGFDMIFIHQTIFDDKLSPYINKRKKNWKERWIFNTKRNIPYMIFHSGRGKQEHKLPQNVSFLEYSALQEYVLREPSKFFLTLLGMGAKGI